ncbi:MAG: dihydrodipicolinate synthase family protein, partial [Acidobacteria bacterium]|nr:dihydrodipicolinate synthase family protein [Acidobacteriota bacterium]
LRGIFPPVPTPFDSATGDVDLGALRTQLIRLTTSGLAGALVLGSNAEAGLLEEAEADAIVDTARAVVPRDQVLIVGTGRESTRATIAACRRAGDLGADVALVRAPSFFKSQMTHEALLAHYRAVADASPVPVMLYNVPGMAGFSLTVATVQALAAHPNVVGIKETSNDLERHAQFAMVRPETFAVLSGWAPVAYPAWMMGARGAIIAVANVFPASCAQLWAHAQAGRHDEARALQQQLLPIARLVSSVHGVAGLKCALDARGFPGGPVRSPLLPVSPAVADDIRAACAAF